MTNIVPFAKENLPVSSGLFDDEPDLQVAGGFPVISIKGKVFHVLRGDQKELVTRNVDGEDIPAPSIEVVVVRANGAVSKTYYEHGYEDGSSEKPDCYSDDGVAPAADAQTPQSKACATCPHNQWGSRITDSGAKGKACSDLRRLAVANPGVLDDPMLLRVPAMSLKPLGEYQKKLKKHGVALQEVVTRVSFDPGVAHPSLIFKPVGFLDDVAALQTIKETMESPTTKQIIGLMPMPATEPAATRDNLIEDDDDDEIPAQAAPPKKAAAKKAATKKAATKKAAAKKPKVEPKADSGDNGQSDDLVSKATAALDDFDDDLDDLDDELPPKTEATQSDDDDWDDFDLD